MKRVKAAEKRSSDDQNSSQQQKPVSLGQMSENGQNLSHTGYCCSLYAKARQI